MSDRRLIETWLPIAEIGVESVRERTPMTPFPAPNRLHVWWARRPLVASRAAVLASLLPADADQARFKHVLGIHGDPIATRRKIDKAKRTGERFEGDAYGYPRAFTYVPNKSDRAWIEGELARAKRVRPTVLDPTAGGGSIPFESVRLGFDTWANDLNPVAAMVMKATIELPLQHGPAIREAYDKLAKDFLERRERLLSPFFPAEPQPNQIATNWIWARTITCPYCDGLIPLSPNWRLAPDGTGVKLHPNPKTKRCTFEIVTNAKAQSEGTVNDGDARCPYPECGRVVDGDEVKRQAQAGKMGEQLYAIVFKRRVQSKTKTGRVTEKWERGYRAPTDRDDVSALVQAKLDEMMPEWEALDVIPREDFPQDSNDLRPLHYGMAKWRNMFSARQLLGHATAAQLFRDLIDGNRARLSTDQVLRAAFGYLAFVLDKMLNYNSRMSVWMSIREVVANTFNRHDFSFAWSHAEMAPLITGLGYDWAIEQTGKCIDELVELVRPDAPLKKTASKSKKAAVAQSALDLGGERFEAPSIAITNQTGDSLGHLADATVDAVVMDPPYYDNVMYAELSDFFYVWLKRTAGRVYPELFRTKLTDKTREAVANAAKFKGETRAKERASRDYQERMAAIFAECRRVLKANGILTLMFTHKATGAWDALTSGLMEAGFTITASWPINTEAEGSLHIKDKAAANSTIFLVCRVRPDKPSHDKAYWEDVEPLVQAAVREKVQAFEGAGIRGVDLYLSCFGPALEEFAKHWPLVRGQPTTQIAAKKGMKKPLAEGEAVDPYAVSPEDALQAARREVKRWRIDKLLRTSRHADMDPMTEFFVLAWDTFKAPTFPYDEAMQLSRVVGIDLDKDILKKLGEKKASDVILWDSAARAAKGALGPADGSRALIDVIHHAAHRARTGSLDAAREQLRETKADQLSGFVPALSAVLEVLPVGQVFTRVQGEKGAVAEAANDFDALEQLRRLAYSDRVSEPEQLRLWKDAT